MGQRIAPETTQSLLDRGLIKPETAQLHAETQEMMPAQTTLEPDPVLEPTFEATPPAGPVVDPSTPAPRSELDDIVEGAQAEAEGNIAKTKAAALSTKVQTLMDKKEALRAKAKRMASPSAGGGGGYLGGDVAGAAEGRGLSPAEIKEKLAVEFAEIQTLESEIDQERQVLGIEPQRESDPNLRNADFDPNADPGAMATAEMPRIEDDPGYQTYMAAYDNQIEAVNQSLDQGEAAANQEASYHRAANKNMEEDFHRNQAEIMKGEQKVQKAFQDLEAKQAEMEKETVDQDRFWASKSTGQKILAGIGLFLGATGGGPNRAAALINRQVEKDLQMQENAIKGKKENLLARRGILKDMMGVYGDMQTSLNASRASYYRKMENDVNAMLAKTNNQNAKLKGMQLLGELQIKKQQALDSFAKNVSLRNAMQSGEVNAMDLPEKMQDLVVPGLGVAVNKKVQTDLVEKKTAVESSKNIVKELLKISSMPGKSLTPEIRARAKSMVAMLKGRSKTEIVGSGAVTEAEWAMLDSVIPNPAAVFSLDSSNRAVLIQFMKIMDDGLRRAAQNGLRIQFGRGRGRPIRTRERSQMKPQFVRGEPRGR